MIAWRDEMLDWVNAACAAAATRYNWPPGTESAEECRAIAYLALAELLASWRGLEGDFEHAWLDEFWRRAAVEKARWLRAKYAERSLAEPFGENWTLGDTLAQPPAEPGGAENSEWECALTALRAALEEEPEALRQALLGERRLVVVAREHGVRMTDLLAERRRWLGRMTKVSQ